jgi:hypothetical protein
MIGSPDHNNVTTVIMSPWITIRYLVGLAYAGIRNHATPIFSAAAGTNILDWI